MRNPVMVIPGYYGSKLRDRLSNELLWIDSHAILHSGETLDAIRLDTGDEDRVVASGILDEIHILGFISPDVYKPLLNFLADELRYRPEEIYPFFLDWRKSVTESADDLQLRIASFLGKNGADKVNLVCHSHGGLVARAYMQRHGSEKIDNFITLGTPHKGMLKTMIALDRGIGIFGFSPSHVRDVSRSFPSAYELLPVDPSDGLFHLSGAPADPFIDNNWAPTPKSKALLQQAGNVIKSLPRALPVKSTFIYGTHLTTATRADATASGALTFVETDGGDTGIPLPSASGQGLTGPITRFPVPYGIHSALFNYPEAKRVIKDILLERDDRPHFVVGFASGPMFRANSVNSVSVELRDHTGAPLPGAAVQLRLGSTKKKVDIPQTANGDFFRTIKMPGKGQHVEYEILASATNLPKPVVERGILFSANV